MKFIWKQHGAATRHGQAGQSIVEAVFVLALVAIVTIVLVSGVGRDVSERLRTTQNALEPVGSVTTGSE